MMHLRRMSILAVSTVAAFAVGVAPAAAHFCYHNDLTPQATAGMLGSNAYTSFGELAFQFTGLCPAGIEVLADAAGITVDTPIHSRTVMAGGLAKQGRSNPAIGHLDFEAIDAAFPDAVAACG
jgi:hypothetical protein